jgi:hypothetical protein
MNPHYLEILAVVVGIGYLVWNVIRSRSHAFGGTLAWDKDLLVLLVSAKQLRERFHWLKANYLKHPYFERPSPEALASPSTRDPVLLDEWNTDFWNHIQDLNRLASSYHWWSHFWRPRPSFSILGRLGEKADWEKILQEHENEVRSLT